MPSNWDWEWEVWSFGENAPRVWYGGLNFPLPEFPEYSLLLVALVAVVVCVNVGGELTVVGVGESVGLLG